MRFSACVGLAVMSLLPIRVGRAQDVSADFSQRGPRFLMSGSREATRVDVARAPVLRRRIALDLQDVSMHDALTTIAKESGLQLMFSDKLLSSSRMVTLRAQAITVAAALTEVLLDAQVDVLFSSSGNAALIRRSDGVAVAGTITGRVVDSTNHEGLSGVTVAVEGTRLATTSGGDGRYTIGAVPAGRQSLVARRLGYKNQTRAVEVTDGGSVTADFVLFRVPTTLTEIVVTPTGEQRLLELGHVVGRINADSVVRAGPVGSMSELLAARVPGLQVFQTQGTVGGSVRLQVRGLNSLNTRNEPIVVIDGIRYTTESRGRLSPSFFTPGDVESTSPLNDVNVNSIESIEVVKGPSASTLYGTDAANGVIVITTKRGKPGAARWNAYVRSTLNTIPRRNFDPIYFGWGTVNGIPNNARASCTLERLASRQCTKQDSVVVLLNPLNDSRYTIFGAKPSREYGINVGGGIEALRYFFSANLEDVTGPIQMPPQIAEMLKQRRGLSELPREWRDPNAFTKLNLRSNLTSFLGNTAQLHINTAYVRNDSRNLSFRFNPYEIAFFGGLPGSPSPYTSTYSLYDPAEAYSRTASDKTDRFIGAGNGNWQPASWLTTRATIGVDILNANHYALSPPGISTAFAIGAVEDTRSQQVATSFDAGATAAAQRNGFTTRTAIGGQFVRNLYTSSGIVGRGLSPATALPQSALYIATSQQYRETVVFGGFVEEMLGVYDRLFLTGALRSDGASTFGRNADVAVYPKLSASWLISSEPFFARFAGGDRELRLRYAFGASGKQPNPSWARPSFFASQMNLNGAAVQTLALDGLGNPSLKPERVREHEFGFDASAFAARFRATSTWFQRRTTDQLITQCGPIGSGCNFVNLGLTTQRGFEQEVTIRPVDSRLISWDLMLTHTDLRTALVDLGRATGFRSLRGGYVVGYPLGARFDRVVSGWNDANGDGIITYQEIQLTDTAVYLGESVPPRSETLTSTLGLFQGRLRLSALAERKSGFTQVNDLACKSSGGVCRGGVDRNASFEEQVRAKFPQVQSGDFTRLREVSVGVDVPPAWMHAVRISNATVVFSARNLALWTAFTGPDPEVGEFSGGVPSNLESGLASGIPLGRSFSLRIDAAF